MMKKEMKLPRPVDAYIRAINAGDAGAFPSNFAQDAVVKDVDLSIGWRSAGGIGYSPRLAAVHRD
jgi:hypothetical protein